MATARENILSSYPPLMTIGAAAGALSVSDDTIRALVNRHEVASVRIGRSLRIVRDDLEGYIVTHILTAPRGEALATIVDDGMTIADGENEIAWSKSQRESRRERRHRARMHGITATRDARGRDLPDDTPLGSAPVVARITIGTDRPCQGRGGSGIQITTPKETMATDGTAPTTKGEKMHGHDDN